MVMTVDRASANPDRFVRYPAVAVVVVVVAAPSRTCAIPDMPPLLPPPAVASVLAMLRDSRSESVKGVNTSSLRLCLCRRP